MYKKLIISFVLITLMVLSFFKPIDTLSSEQLDKAFARSLTVFAIARSLNGLVSVLQGTQVYATPAGVGVNFAVGQILDPMNDMLERFSWLMLMSSIALGIEELLLHLGQTPLMQGLFSLSVTVLLLVLWFPKLWHKQSFELMFKTVIIFSFLRFFVPMSILFSEGVYTYALQNQYEQAKESLELTQVQTEIIVQQVRHNSSQHKTSWLASLNISQQIDDFKQEMHVLWNNLKTKFDKAIDYMLSLIVIFIFQSLMLPLLFLWVLVKFTKKLMGVKLYV